MKDTTLALAIDWENNKILLGMKKRGFGQGRWNGFGGKLEEGESLDEGIVRETKEETGIDILEHEKIGEMDFFFQEKPEWNQKVHLFLIKQWKGDAVESEEMRPKWFNFNEIPFNEMWPDDTHWMPKVLSGKRFKGSFTFDEKEGIADFCVEELAPFKK